MAMAKVITVSNSESGGAESPFSLTALRPADDR
jgi:hypothetical protein